MSDEELVKELCTRRLNRDGTVERLASVAAARIEALAARVAELEPLLKECSDELSDLVEHYYEKTKDHPSELRRYERDIEPVIKARAALGEAS